MCRTVLLAITVLISAGVWAEPLRDPTRPLDYRSRSAAPTLELQSVLISDARKLAVINGHSLREQDPLPGLEGAFLQRIESGSVLIRQGQTTWRLRLSDQSVRR